MNFRLLTLLLLFTASLAQCTCSQLITQLDCVQNESCLWNSLTTSCEDADEHVVREGYCSTLTQEVCSQTVGCAYYRGLCTYFSGCTSYYLNSNQECQAISNICVSDGTRCVARASECNAYLTAFSCKARYKESQIVSFCFWDNKQNVCRDANSCLELPRSLQSDAQCRKQISRCTAKPAGGCMESGKTCADQYLRSQCVTNLDGTVQCFWDGKNCKDRSCSVAPITLTTDKDCKDFLTICTAKKDGGCVERKACSDALILAACVFDKDDQPCIWLEGACYNRICASGRPSMFTNKECQTINENCITKFGGGCTENGECMAAETLAACQVDKYGNPCMWTGFLCLRKTCDLAPLTIMTESECGAFLPTCVLRPSGKGCVSLGCTSIENEANCRFTTGCTWRQQCDDTFCSSAPATSLYDSHEECEAFRPSCTVKENFKGCEEKKLSCSDYKNEVQCQKTLNGSNCAWVKDRCQVKTCENAPPSRNTHRKCTEYLSQCTVNDKADGCMELKPACNLFKLQGQCEIDSNKNKCTWLNGQCLAVSCDLAPKLETFNTHDECETFLDKCTVQDRIGNGCVTIPANCSDLQQHQCSQLADGTKCTWFKGECVVKNCEHFVPNSSAPVTHEICEAWMPHCTRGQGYNPRDCIRKPPTCSEAYIEEFQCVVDISGKVCAWLNGKCQEKTCALFPDAANQQACEKWMPNCRASIVGGEDSNKCHVKNNGCASYTTIALCTIDKDGKICHWNYDTSACEERTCANVTNGLAEQTHVSCETWLVQCTVNDADITKCKQKPANCSDLIEQQCFTTFSKQNCAWFSAACRVKSCETKSGSVFNHTECSAYLSTCTINSTNNGCILKQTLCSSYTYSAACQDTISGQKCFWKNGQCVNRTCQDSTLDNNFDSDQECKGFMTSCTVAFLGGCKMKQICSNYLREEQCRKTLSGLPCYWNAQGKCVDKICTNSPILTTHQQCQAFDVACTIDGNTMTGCVNLAAKCSDYRGAESCHLQRDRTKCFWQRVSCKVRECTDAVTDTYITHQACTEFLENCTVTAIGSGCINLKNQCRQYENQRQCVTAQNNIQCRWQDGSCVSKRCSDELPLAIVTNQNCLDYSPSCKKSYFSCRESVCEDYQYTTDAECRLNNLRCTSNGQFCVYRGLCNQAQTQAGCVTDFSGKLCGWNASLKQCEYLNCETAPLSLKTESDCEKYWPDSKCTTKLGGGCTQKKTCSDANVKEACTTSASDEVCIWANEICRTLECWDYPGITIKECEEFLPRCTTNGESCVNKERCSSYITVELCQVGLDGVCIWHKGKCKPYTQCRDVDLQSSQECKMKLGRCISNQITCVPMNICSEYTTQYECVEGVDGPCYWDLTSNRCGQFKDCYSFKFNTHLECSTINSSCTSEGKGCQILNSCRLYPNPESCKVSRSGIRFDKDGQIIATGKCVWNQAALLCDEEGCEQLKGLTHDSCNAQLSKCTSNGIRCMTMQKCSTYTDPYICRQALGSDGYCYFDEECKVMKCSDQTNQDDCLLKMDNCQFIEGQCEVQRKCSEYTSSAKCRQGVDGYCTWSRGACKPIKACADADNDQDLCRKYPNQCYWVSATDQTASKCKDHTCETIYRIGTCGYVELFDGQLIYCYFDGQFCKEADVKTLTEETCYALTHGHYFWNTTSCKSCSKISEEIQEAPTNTTNPVGQQGGILIMLSLVMVLDLM